VRPREATRVVGRARTVAILRALEMRLRVHGGRLHGSVDPSARIDGPIELRLLNEGEGPWELSLELGPHAWLGKGIGIEVSRGRNRIRVGGGSQVGTGVRIWTRRGEIDFGPRVQVREYSTFEVSGRLDVGADALIGLGCQVHCAERIELQERSAIAQGVTVLDHDHAVDGSDEWWARQPSAVEPVVIGYNTVVTAGARVLRGARLGRNSIGGANSVVRSGVYPDGSVLVGTPARLVKTLG
jgi:acetyltransferase-like isoleucine patch superfamily enzyme